MAKTKREFIIATCFLSGAAALVSLVALGTQEWVTSPAKSKYPNDTYSDEDFIRIGLFGGVFKQETAHTNQYELTMVCAFDLNICALLCGDNMEDNLRKLYKGEQVNDLDQDFCPQTVVDTLTRSFRPHLREAEPKEERIFINSGVWLSTIIFLVISALFGLISAGLAIWNTVSTPYQDFLSTFGLYIYNAIAFCSILFAIILWGVMFSMDLRKNIPSYKTFLEDFTTDGYASLGYSYWINLASLILYLISLCLLYIRDYLISKEPKVNLELEESADPVLYLY